MSKKSSPVKSAEEDTPMMQQYLGIKREHPGAILFFRMGDFYEMFFEDARTASKILEIALTSRSKKSANPIPMCGIPHHSAHLYIAKLIKNGKTVAVCEQTEDPRQVKGLVRREVVRIITPGTVVEDHLLDPKEPHFIASLFFGKKGTGLAALDISTGRFQLMQMPANHPPSLLHEELAKLDPKEVLFPESVAGNGNSSSPAELNRYLCIARDDWTYQHGQARRCLLDHFNMQSLEGFGCEDWPAAVCAAGGLLFYIQETQKTALKHITRLVPVNLTDKMMLDEATINSLELIQASDGSRQHSLLGLLDQCHTPMGSRRIREWLLQPLLDSPSIVERQDTVAAFEENPLLASEVKTLLGNIFDLERLLARISLQSSCSPRDLGALRTSLNQLPGLSHVLFKEAPSALLRFQGDWDDLADVAQCIDHFLVEDPPPTLKDGQLIRSGCDPELDRLQEIAKNGNQAIALLEARERERTKIPQLKVGYNKIYGYYLEVTKKNLDRVPDDFIRKQSLVNAERYISPELKKLEEDITGAEEKIRELEQTLFQKMRHQVAEEGPRIQKMGRILSEIDALAGFAELSRRNHYCRPKIVEGSSLIIENGRHPLIENIDPATAFIPNDCQLDCAEQQVMIITGPNMAGKSTFLRQVALIALMAQMGCNVPADRVEMGLVDRVFCRVGAHDHLLKGQSTFMVEMNETANILNNATENSLIILDEIGRGTSTFDGLSLAWALVEFLHGKTGLGAKTLFATHYHELTELANLLPGVKNYNIQVKEWNDEIIFLRKIVPGGADKSYGIQVARLAGLPESLLLRAQEVLQNHESNEFDAAGVPKRGIKEATSSGPSQLGLFPEAASPLVLKLRETDADNLTPRQALDLVYQLLALVNPSSK